VAITPSLAVGILEGITRRRVIELLRDVHEVTTVEREIGRTELYVADELFLCSTLAEIQPVIDVDGYPIGDRTAGRLTVALRDHYIACCEAGPDAPAGWLTPLS
jgi:branched-chain amino acid aminotransferase